MKWLDVAAPPGCGKSTLCYPIWGDKSVGWDGLNPPAHWRLFLDEITALMHLVKDHPSFEAVIRMNDRSAKKMATVYRMQAPGHQFNPTSGVPLASFTKKDSPNFDNATWFSTVRPSDAQSVFIQTGWCQRILGFGWRLVDMDRDVNLIRRALRWMPVSVGVVFLTADLETILARNNAREGVPETAHENRSYQVPLMLPAIEVAKEVLRDRGVPVLELDVQHQSIDAARAGLVDFAGQGACAAAQVGLGSEVSLLQAPPPWWRS